MCCMEWFFRKKKPSINNIKVEKVIGECPICFEDIIVNKINLALPCGHVFHETCITRWIKINRSCPLCYYQL